MCAGFEDLYQLQNLAYFIFICSNNPVQTRRDSLVLSMCISVRINLLLNNFYQIHIKLCISWCGGS